MLYPEIEPNTSDWLPVSGGHKIYYETSGTPKGIPVLFLHGGPGGGLPHGYQRFFDPNVYYIIGFDQRGCGNSTPHGCLENNTTDDLLNDIFTLKSRLNIDKWVVFGGSWGATLALLLGIKDPSSVLAIILRGTFLARQKDIDWFLGPHGGASQLFPDIYDAFTQPIGKKSDSHSVCAAYTKELSSNNELKRINAIKAWYQWEERLSRLALPANYSNGCHAPLKEMTSMALLECHYISNHCFIEEDFILDNIHTLADVPGIIIHGRYDSICTVSAAYEVNKKWTNSELSIIPKAGHSTAEPSISSALTQATRQVARFLRPDS